MIDIMDDLSQYSKQKKIILYRDGLSMERVHDAQVMRVHAGDVKIRLQLLVGQIQEWHKRILLLEVCL